MNHQITKVHKELQQNTMSKLLIMHHNIRGLNNKLEELNIKINEINPDIITLNETLKIKPNTYIHGYTITQPLQK